MFLNLNKLIPLQEKRNGIENINWPFGENDQEQKKIYANNWRTKLLYYKVDLLLNYSFNIATIKKNSRHPSKVIPKGKYKDIIYKNWHI